MQKLYYMNHFIIRANAEIVDLLVHHKFNISTCECITWATIEKYPKLEWDYTDLSKNSSIAVSDIIRCANRPWCWESVSHRAQIHHVTDRPDLPWSWPILSKRIHVMDMLSTAHLPWSWLHASSNVTLTYQNVLDHPDKPWSWFYMSGNPNILFADVRRNLHREWSWTLLSCNPSITWPDVRDNMDRSWDWFALCKNPGLAVDDILDMLVQRNSCTASLMFALSQNPNIQQRHFAASTLPWDWRILNRKFNISTPNRIYAPDWRQLFASGSITWKPDMPKSMYLFASSSPMICISDVREYLALWDWPELTRTMTLDDIISNMDLPWSRSIVPTKSFARERNVRCERMIRRHLAALRIQLYWRKATTSITYELCHRLQSARLLQI